jgi:hypothetical protein
LFRIISNPNFQRAIGQGAIKLVKVGAMTVLSVWLSRTTHEAGKSLIGDIAQDVRQVRFETATKEA